MSAVVTGYGRMPLVGFDDFADERMTDHVLSLQMGEGDVIDAVKNAFDGGQT